MPILNQQEISLTTEQKQLQVSKNLRAKSLNMMQVIVRDYTQIATMVFANRLGLTPQEVFNAIGEDGAELVSLATALRQIVNTAAPDTLPDFPVALTVNQDGTVTVG
jgi:ActR/RegA family two-component response regulator